MYISVIIPTYNRLPILKKCLKALAQQQVGAYDDYEVVVVDDGSTDGTIAWLQQARLPRVRWFEQNHGGPAVARNFGCTQAKGDTIIFIDSDLVVVKSFLAEHARALTECGGIAPDPKPVFTYGRVVNTSNFDRPDSESFKPTDFSAAYFATGNVAIARHWLERASESADGPFDTRFQLYGWEDLELGVRLKKLGLQLLKCPAATGYHWHPPFSLHQVPHLIEQERQRGRMGILFYRKHPTWEVRLMIQMTLLHRILWGLLSLGGWLNETRLEPLLQWLIDRNKPGWALELCRICFLNWYNVQSVYAARQQLAIPAGVGK